MGFALSLICGEVQLTTPAQNSGAETWPEPSESTRSKMSTASVAMIWLCPSNTLRYIQSRNSFFCAQLALLLPSRISLLFHMLRLLLVSCLLGAAAAQADDKARLAYV